MCWTKQVHTFTRSHYDINVLLLFTDCGRSCPDHLICPPQRPIYYVEYAPKWLSRGLIGFRYNTCNPIQTFRAGVIDGACLASTTMSWTTQRAPSARPRAFTRRHTFTFCPENSVTFVAYCARVCISASVRDARVCVCAFWPAGVSYRRIIVCVGRAPVCVAYGREKLNTRWRCSDVVELARAAESWCGLSSVYHP